MTHKRVVLVTGVASHWGAAMAARLSANPDLHVMGLDAEPPAEPIKGLDFVQADLRNPLLPELLAQEGVDAVCHLAFEDSLRPSESAFEQNVLGTMQLLTACAQAGVRKVVLRSSTLVYGARASNSAYLREDHPLQAARAYGYLRDLVELEAFCNGFRVQNPQLQLTVLRFAHIVGPEADTPLTRFLREEEALVLMGFDPLMQVIHEQDVLAALEHACLNDVPGVFNLAAEGVLPLWRLIGLTAKVAVPVLHPLAYLSVSVFGPRYAPIDLDYLRYPCVGDLHKMRHELGFVPQYTAVEALREFAAQQRLRAYLPESANRAYDIERLRDTLERRRRLRQQTGQNGASADPDEVPAGEPASEAEPQPKPRRRAPSRKSRANGNGAQADKPARRQPRARKPAPAEAAVTEAPDAALMEPETARQEDSANG
jgi:UDP-glucose 4-epimerase